MKTIIALLTATSVLASSFLVTGCDRTLSKSETTKVRSDGSVKETEKKVTEKSDGTIEKTEQTKKTSPNP